MVVKMRPGSGQDPQTRRRKALTSPGHVLTLISGLVRVATMSVGELSDCFPASPWSPAAICCLFGSTEGTNKVIDMRRGKTPKHYTACLKVKLWVIKLDSGRNTGTRWKKQNQLKMKAEDCRKHLDNGRKKTPHKPKWTLEAGKKGRVQTLWFWRCFWR